ncbi:class I SAM-dependent methyltransferase [Amycolatopsis acidicola]|uniref:class I SAM-dependent methyltransferase n=1 Tax=Amycolatopsis acidicola TaxID=2596893 RepID=UPI00140B78CD|nr:class I SAM-dependent methyltransferase [Amycolatopsis acidicola]
MTGAGVRARLIRATFNAASAQFDAEPLFFWRHCGTRTVELAGVGPGDRVLDACCGTGASAIPAARLAGPSGRVVGIDLAERQLDRARDKASSRGLGNIEFRQGDLTALELAGETYDVVVCVLGVYFAEDVPAALAGLWRAVRPGGTLAITTWGRRRLAPAGPAFLDLVGEERPDLRQQPGELERISTPSALRSAFAAGGVPRPVVDEETVTVRMTPDEFWTVVLGTGYRLLVELLGPAASERVRLALREKVGGGEIACDFLFARAVRPGPRARRRSMPGPAR